MHIYILLKQHGQWSNGSSEAMVRKLCELIDFNDELVYTQGKPSFLHSNYFLSVSHSANVMAIAIASQDIGIDLEKNRDIKSEVIDRVQLNKDQPLVDWCQREALIKLFNDPDYLFKPAPEGICFTTLNVFDGFTCVIASMNEPDDIKLFHLKEEAL